MRLIIQKWGNSLALRIPSAVAHEIGVKKGSTVELAAGQDTLFFKVVRKRKKTEITLDELLARVTLENQHDFVDVGPAVGREVVTD
ncbi:MAG TPA: AbrB/MazE/SpoVT family DNA-binding domain-containing protein [Gammaproteobacteria bacterium]|nr:AbrB/MazE/SpoVT family DNA-binding domain-containing protein [Gammaproteobacteria bacterium]